MPYCTLGDILGSMDEADIVAYTDEYDSGQVNQDTVDKAIGRADAKIDSYLARHYQVPMSPVPDLVRGLAVDIAVYRICSHKSAAPDERRKDYDDAIRQLEKIAAGKAVVPDAKQAEPDTSGHSASIESPARKFTDELMEKY